MLSPGCVDGADPRGDIRGGGQGRQLRGHESAHRPGQVLHGGPVHHRQPRPGHRHRGRGGHRVRRHHRHRPRGRGCLLHEEEEPDRVVSQEAGGELRVLREPILHIIQGKRQRPPGRLYLIWFYDAFKKHRLDIDQVLHHSLPYPNSHKKVLLCLFLSQYP